MNNTIKVTIRGISPLLMHKFPLIPIEAMQKQTPQEQAEHAAYRDKDGNLIIPGVNVLRAIIGAAAYTKGKGRASLQKQAAACVQIQETELPVGKNYEIDARPVVIAATKGRIVRYRPRINEWQVTFHVDYDPTLISEKELRQIVDDTGSRVGLLDFRPERKGPFGRFMVTEWKNAAA
jgi:hypothetical protein